jgi:hypothetical protein
VPSLATSPGIAKLVERQMRNWELARRQRDDVAATERPETGDFICLSRPVGVDVAAVGRRLHEALGWPVFDQQVLDHMAGDDRARRQLYEAMDQRDLAWWEEMVQPLIRGRFQPNDYFHRLCDTLLALARQGDAIFVGRAADLILPASRGLRVRLLASTESRLRHLAESQGFGPREARQELERVDADRREFLLRHFSLDSEEPTRHDVLINLDRLSADQASQLILSAHRMRSAAGG